MRIHIDKIASVTRNLRLQRTLTLTSDIQAVPGAVVAGRVLGEKTTYNQLEDVHGRMSILHGGDIVVGALGHRNALHGYEGVMPSSVAVGDRLNILNLGGVIGTCVSHNPDVGRPFEVEILGQVLIYPDFGSRVGQPATIQMGSLEVRAAPKSVPVVFVAGTCMNAGKTAAACALVRHFTQAGLKVGGAKLTGVSLQRDILGMKDYGADVAFDFTDAGVVCTNADNALASARTLLAHVAESGADVIVAETGDGIMGDYGVQAILADPELRGLAAAFLLCANDPVGASGGVRELSEKYGIQVDVVTGPATDTRVGVRFVERELHLPAIHARNGSKARGAHVLEKVQARMVKA